MHMRKAPIDRLQKPFNDLVKDQSNSGILLLIMAVIAMVWANSPWSDAYHHLLEHTISIGFDGWALERNLHHWINDGLMAMFFFLVGLELKREIVGGELSQPRNAVLPVMAGIGGMLVPALIYLAFGPTGAAQDGWGIPMATDIAFAVGLMALLGSRAPMALKVFITTLAMADDLGAVLVIALFYTSEVSLDNVALGAGFMVLLVLGNFLGIRTPWYYGIVGIAGMWTAFLMSGIHATVAGVLAAFTIPAETKLGGRTYITKLRGYIDEFAGHVPNTKPTLTSDQLHTIEKIERASSLAQTPLQRLEHRLQPLVMYIVVPLFALANAGVRIPHDLGAALSGSVAMGVGLGLLLGKPIGICLFSWVSVKLGLGTLGKGVTWRHVVGAAFLAGIGFTMSLFINELAFHDADLKQQAKLGIILASLLAGAIGYGLLRTAPNDGSPS